MALAIPAMMMAGSAISAMGAISQANAQQAASSYNATIKEREAGLATEQATQDVQQVRWAAKRAEGSLLAGYGASGVTTDTGSPLDVLANSASQAKLDEETVLFKGKLKAMGLNAGAELDRTAGKTAKQQGPLNAASYLLGGAGQAAGTYATVNRPYLYGEI